MRRKSNPVSSWLHSLLFSNLALFAFDPEDQATKDAIDAAVAKATEGLATKNRELLGEVKKLKKGGEIDPADYERLNTELEDVRTKHDQAVKDLKALQKTHETTAKTLEGEQGFTNRLLIENGLTAALGENGIKDPAYLKAAVALIRSTASPTVKVDGETRAAVIGDKTLGDFVKAWATSDEGKAFVSAPGNAGGGAQGGQGGGGSTVGNMGGTPAERAQALAAKFPELASNAK